MKHASQLPDFVEHLAERLGLERDAALERLGDWLHRYQPVRRREIRVLQVREVAEPKAPRASFVQESRSRRELRIAENDEASGTRPELARVG
ncbi:MAG TPA: hypothetical protein VFQ35_06550 [Polyangiaceae bacterium]|nr:hypothetical protein [Polyangiaceae bacterium]